MSQLALDSMPFLYVVRCRFEPRAQAHAESWLQWLRDEHLADVLSAGACRAEIFEMSDEDLVYEIHYRFAGPEAFAAYERDHAPRLRAEGLARFPLEWGLHYERRTGNSLEIVPK